MNKAQLVSAVAEYAEVDKKTAAKVIDAALDAVQNAVAAGDKVTIPGFGSFERRYRDARTARDPRNGGTVHVAAKHVPAFRPGSGFKSTVAANRTLVSA